MHATSTSPYEYFRAIEQNNKRLASNISCWVVASKETDFDLPADTNLWEAVDDVSPSDSISNVGSRAVSTPVGPSPDLPVPKNRQLSFICASKGCCEKSYFTGRSYESGKVAGVTKGRTCSSNEKKNLRASNRNRKGSS